MAYRGRVKRIRKMDEDAYFVESFDSPLHYLIVTGLSKFVIFILKIVFFPITILVWLFKKK